MLVISATVSRWPDQMVCCHVVIVVGSQLRGSCTPPFKTAMPVPICRRITSGYAIAHQARTTNESQQHDMKPMSA